LVLAQLGSSTIVPKRKGVVGTTEVCTEPIRELPFIDDFSLLVVASEHLRHA
jgi:hypothetical protein